MICRWTDCKQFIAWNVSQLMIVLWCVRERGMFWGVCVCGLNVYCGLTCGGTRARAHTDTETNKQTHTVVPSFSWSSVLTFSILDGLPLVATSCLRMFAYSGMILPPVDQPTRALYGSLLGIAVPRHPWRAWVMGCRLQTSLSFPRPFWQATVTFERFYPHGIFLEVHFSRLNWPPLRWMRVRTCCPLLQGGWAHVWAFSLNCLSLKRDEPSILLLKMSRE